MSPESLAGDGWIAVHFHLEDVLDNYQAEHESWYQAPATTEDTALGEALSAVGDHALEALRTGRIPQPLAERIQEFEAWRPLSERVTDLLKYTYVHRRMEFEVASEVLLSLRGVEDRLLVSFVAMLYLQQASPLETASKYLQQVSELYLAGFEAPVFVLASAVLEAALRDRIPDEVLAAAGYKPQYKKTKDYSIAQRLEFVNDQGILTAGEQERFWHVVNWRNDVVHVQPDITASPDAAVFEVASLLARILPRQHPS